MSCVRARTRLPARTAACRLPEFGCLHGLGQSNARPGQRSSVVHHHLQHLLPLQQAVCVWPSFTGLEGAHPRDVGHSEAICLGCGGRGARCVLGDGVAHDAVLRARYPLEVGSGLGVLDSDLDVFITYGARPRLHPRRIEPLCSARADDPVMKKATAVKGIELWLEQVHMWHRECVRNR